jgi:hypothetical protein
VFLVTIHESFQLVNYHIFSNFGTPISSELPDGDGGAAAEVALFGGRVISEWEAQLEAPSRISCRNYLITWRYLVSPLSSHALNAAAVTILHGSQLNFGCP